MQPTGPVSPNLLQLLTSSRAEVPAPRLQVGQTLMATVVSSDKGQTTLQMGRQLLQAQTGQLKLTPGETLKLEVMTLGRLPVLRVIAQAQQNVLAQALRQSLPQQQPLPQSLANLAQSLSASATRQLPPQVVQLVRDVLNRLPDPAKASNPQGLKQSLKDSGTFLEAKLASPGQTRGESAQTAQTAARQDFKAGLLQLAQALRQGPTGANTQATAGTRPAATATPAAPTAATTPTQPAATTGTQTTAATPPLPGSGREQDIVAALRRGMPPRPQPSASLRIEGMLQPLRPGNLLRHVEAALSRIHLTQMASTPAPERPQLAEWLIELPIRQQDERLDLWGLRISRDGGDDNDSPEQDGNRWTVTLAFDLPGLGPMQSRVTLGGADRDRLTALFLSEDGNTLPVVREHLPMLRARLEQAGLIVDTLGCHQGQLPEPVTSKHDADDGLLDEKA